MEAASRPPLHLVVNQATGEHTERCQGCIDKEAAIERLTRSYEGTIRNLKAELEGPADDPRGKQVRWVLAYWRDRAKPKAKIVPGSERWVKTRARLKEGFTYEELMVAVDGALLSDYHRSHGYLDAKTIFRDSSTVEAHLDRALSPEAGRLHELERIPDEIANHPFREEHLLSRCDYCNCLSLDHSKPDPFRDHRRPCLSCEDCTDFDDTEWLAAEWSREFERRQRLDRVREERDS